MDIWIYEALSDQIDREFDLLNQRMNWLVTGSAFLFTALALSAANVASSPHIILVRLLEWIPGLGILLCGVSLSSMAAGWHVVETRKASRAEFEQKILSKYGRPDLKITVDQESPRHRVGQVPYWLVPVALLVVWLVLLFS